MEQISSAKAEKAQIKKETRYIKAINFEKQKKKIKSSLWSLGVRQLLKSLLHRKPINFAFTLEIYIIKLSKQV